MNGYKRYKGAWAPLVFFELGEGDLDDLPAEPDDPIPLDEIEEEDEERRIIGGAKVDVVAVLVLLLVNLNISFSNPINPLVCKPDSKSENSLLETGCNRSSFSKRVLYNRCNSDGLAPPFGILEASASTSIGVSLLLFSAEKPIIDHVGTFDDILLANKIKKVVKANL